MQEKEHLYLRNSKVMDSDQSSPNRLLIERYLKAAGGGRGRRKRHNGYFTGGRSKKCHGAEETREIHIIEGGKGKKKCIVVLK